MSRKENAAVVGVGAAACAACCAGPILGLLAAIGVGAAGGFWLFGVVGLLAATVVGFVHIRRRRRPSKCAPVEQPVEIAPPPGPRHQPTH
jgi:hypothetical protein